MKLLELTTYSAGICGVWARVREESARLAERGHEVRVFSTNFTKGSDKIASPEEKIGKILIKRFPARRLGGESFSYWNFDDAALEFEPEAIIVHSYRHTHTTRALKIAKILKRNGKKCRVFLVTHAPFERGSTRSFIANKVVWLYDMLVGRRMINEFDKVIAISKWEVPYLMALGLKRENLEYIPNGIPDEFFEIKKLGKTENKMLFLGRISPIKSIETAIGAIPHLKDKNIYLEVVGPAEQDYLEQLKTLIKNNRLEKRVIFSPPIYDTKEKIKKLDSARVFILPSKSEGMPQGLIEAMARSKIIVASDILATRDLIRNGKDGRLFNVGDEKDFAKNMELALKSSERLGAEAKKSVEIFRWSSIIEKIEKLIKSS
jgi:glycosyltransferase involved in cell wall biosynthesis